GCASSRPSTTRPGSTPPTSASAIQADRAEQLDLVLEVDVEALARPAARLPDQRGHVGRAGVAGVLDEVRVHRRDARAADLEALEQRPGAELARRVLEHGAEGARLARLGGRALRLHAAHRRLDLGRRRGPQGEHGAGHDLVRPYVGVAVAQVEIGGAALARAV